MFKMKLNCESIEFTYVFFHSAIILCRLKNVRIGVQHEKISFRLHLLHVSMQRPVRC